MADDVHTKRFEEFWNDINGITEMLVKTNPKYTTISDESPLVTDYLLWRMLAESKKNKKKVKDDAS